MSDARIEHAIVGAAFWLVFLIARNPRCTGWEMLVMVPCAMLGTWVPDWDLFLGIGFHRSPLTHSALPVIVLALFMKPYSAYGLTVGFGLGVASHLFWDVMEYGNVHWIPGKFWDQSFLMVNCVGIVLWAFIKEDKRSKRQRASRKRRKADPTDSPGTTTSPVLTGTPSAPTAKVEDLSKPTPTCDGEEAASDPGR